MVFLPLRYRLAGATACLGCWHLPQKEKAPMVYLQITLKIRADRRPAAAEIYGRFKAPFLKSVAGAKSKELLVRDDDVEVLHGFDSKANAEAYLRNPLFERDVVSALAPLLDAPPDVRVYTVA
jgi:hypothetical protein